MIRTSRRVFTLGMDGRRSCRLDGPHQLRWCPTRKHDEKAESKDYLTRPIHREQSIPLSPARPRLFAQIPERRAIPQLCGKRPSRPHETNTPLCLLNKRSRPNLKTYVRRQHAPSCGRTNLVPPQKPAIACKAAFWHSSRHWHSSFRQCCFPPQLNIPRNSPPSHLPRPPRPLFRKPSSDKPQVSRRNTGL